MAEVKRPAVIGIGATGAALAAAVLSGYPEAMLVVTGEESKKALLEEGIEVTGALEFTAKVKNVVTSVGALADFKPDLVYICTKTFHLPKVAEELGSIQNGEFTAVSCHNGLGTEDLLSSHLGADRTLRMTLNYGAAAKGRGKAAVAFFNPPNHLGAVSKNGAEMGKAAAALLTSGGLATEFVDDIGLYVWRKMIMKCSMASICAVTDMTIRDALLFPPTREIALGCFGEALAVAKSLGYDLGEDYVKKAVAYIEEVGIHKDSMCHDLAAGNQTEIDFLGGKVVAYGKEKGIPTPFYTVMADLVRAMEKKVGALG